ncbi:VirB4 family type IV secretion system protein [Glycomyces sp. MUSA5-2]|uniref:VirB4 family type IV secretion system protein n=1 Tax=Glycomyces sp. MUSA5-2 TaxID=2053002 RepID=UPI003008A0AC
MKRLLGAARPRAKTSSALWPSRLWPDAFRVGPRHLACGDGWSCSLVVLDWPASLPLGWVEGLIAPQTHVQVALHVDTVPTETALGKLRRRQARMEANRRYAAAHDRLEDPKLEAAAADTADLVDRLVRGETRMHPMSVYLTVHAPTRAELALAVARIRSASAAQLMDTRPLTERQMLGITATVPVGIDGPGCTKTVDTDVVAAGFPFASPDAPLPGPGERGAFYGINLGSGAPLVWSPWAQDNHNMVVVGHSGVGKSYLVKTLLLRELYQGVEATVIDPEGEYTDLARHVGGTVTRPGAQAINPLALPLEPEADALTRRKMFAGTVVATALGEELSGAEIACVDAAAAEVYEAAGITEDAATWDRRPPTMTDLLTALAGGGSEEGAGLAVRLAPYVTGGLSGLLAGHEDTADGPAAALQVVDLSGVAEELAPLATLLVLDRVWRALRSDGRCRSVIVDEAWLLLSTGPGAKFLSRLAKTARKRTAGLTVVTQDVGDMLASELGHTVIANASTQIVMRQAPQSVAEVAAAFGLSDAERALAATARRGEALLLAGDTRVAFTALASETEHGLCLTGLSRDGGQAS